MDMSSTDALMDKITDNVTDTATRDPLTFLYLRSMFHVALRQQISIANRYNQSLSLILLSIDNLELLSTEYGNSASDKALRQIGSLINHGLRCTDIGARFTTNEFAVLLPHTGQVEAAGVAHFLRKRILYCFAESSKLTSSIGISTLSQLIDGATELTVAADKALHIAKSQGCNKVALHVV